MSFQLQSRQTIATRALLLGDRIDLRAFKIGDCLATTPLTVEVNSEGGIAVLFRFGVIVLFGVNLQDETRFVESIRSLTSNAYTAPEIEELEIRQHQGGPAIQAGVVSLDGISLEKLHLIADALSKHLLLSLYETRVAGEFDWADLDPSAVNRWRASNAPRAEARPA